MQGNKKSVVYIIYGSKSTRFALALGDTLPPKG